MSPTQSLLADTTLQECICIYANLINLLISVSG